MFFFFFLFFFCLFFFFPKTCCVSSKENIQLYCGTLCQCVAETFWPARDSRRSLNIALDFYVWRSVRLAQSAVW